MLVVVTFTMAGCLSNEEAPINQLKTSADSPPSLTVMIDDDDSITSIRGGYSWTYGYDEGEQVTIEADSDSSSNLVNIDNATRVNSENDIRLYFEKTPTDSEIKMWDTDN